FRIILIQSAQPCHINCFPYFLNNSSYHQQITFDNDIVHQVKYNSHNGDFGIKSDSRNQISDVTNNQIRNKSTDTAFVDSTQSSGNHRQNGNNDENILHKFIKLKYQRKSSQHRINPHFGKQPAKNSG